VRGVERAAAYVPYGGADGRPRAGPDEDGFTMAATALERIEPHDSGSPPPGELFLVGDIPGSADTDLVRFLGFPVRTVHHGSGAKALRAALEAARDPARGAEPVVLVAVDLAEAPSSTRSSDGAVAVRVAEVGAPDGPVSWSELPSDGPLSAAGLLEWGRRAGSIDPDRFRGDFAASDGRRLPRTETARPGLSPDGPVSQGAYVPRPRYLENLSSRWRLVGEHCGACGRVGFPPRGRCRSCEATDRLEPIRLPTDGGEVVAVTTIGPGGQPTEFDAQVASTGPYGVVLVELAPGVRGTFQLTDARPGEVGVGAHVATRLRRLYPMEGEWRYGRKAVPLR
jgi:uncharacterized OB-fold protein